MSFEPKNPQRTPAYSFERPAQDQKKPKSALMEEEIYIKIKPKIIVKTLSFVVLFLFIFYLGRWSLDAPDFSFSSKLISGNSPVTGAVTTSEKVATKTVVETAKTTTPVAKVEEKTTTNVVTTTAASVVEVPKTTTTEPNTSTTTTDTAATDEVFLTSYSKVAVALTNLKIDWKGDDWGKITQISYTIKNNEEGAVKADHFILTVENYDDKSLQKKIPLPLSSQKFSAGKSYSQTLNVPSGFTFAESTTGTLANVRIGLSLYDAKDKMMGSFSKEFDLKAYK